MEVVVPSHDELMHYGVKGMKWGQRKRPEGVSARTYRTAKKDAQEFARAKMFYGEGAGTRRKLIKNTVEARSSKDPSYKKAFDLALAEQDMSKHAAKARTERTRKDISKNTAKTARGVKNLFIGSGASVTLASYAIYYAAQNPEVRNFAKQSMNKTMTAVKNHGIDRAVIDYLRKNDFG